MLKPYLSAERVEVGCDEAGRGCLAGAVYAAAVVLPLGFDAPLLNDSKQLNEAARRALRLQIEREAVGWAVGVVSAAEIDEINILQASFLAMHRALEALHTQFEHILVDGNRFKPFQKVGHTCVVKGDGIYQSIAAASILAKTHRDEEMERLHALFPAYGWAQNKGYPTVAHRRAIAQYGITPHHRRTFRLLPEGEQTALFT